MPFARPLCTELLWMIASWLSIDDLRSLRLVCKDFDATFAPILLRSVRISSSVLATLLQRSAPLLSGHLLRDVTFAFAAATVDECLETQQVLIDTKFAPQLFDCLSNLGTLRLSIPFTLSWQGIDEFSDPRLLRSSLVASRQLVVSLLSFSIVHPRAFTTVRNLHLSPYPSRHIHEISRNGVFCAFPALENFEILVLPDFQVFTTFSDNSHGSWQESLDEFFALLQGPVAKHKGIQRLTFGWHTMDGPAPILAAPLHPFCEARLESRETSACLSFSSIKTVTLVNCWTTPPVLEYIIGSLHTKALNLDRVYLSDCKTMLPWSDLCSKLKREPERRGLHITFKRCGHAKQSSRHLNISQWPGALFNLFRTPGFLGWKEDHVALRELHGFAAVCTHTLCGHRLGYFPALPLARSDLGTFSGILEV